MKRIISVLVLFFAQQGLSQEIYQNGVSVTAERITFDVRLGEMSFFLRNTSNVKSREDNLRYKEGRELETLDEYAILDNQIVRGSKERAIREAFGDSIIMSLRPIIRAPLKIFYIISPEGETLEVAFIMNPVPELLSLPPEVFASLEKNLKKYVKWTVNEYGQRLEFLRSLSFIKFENIPLDSELHKIDPDALELPDLHREIME